MIRGKRIAWGVGVLVLGWCAALPFQRRSDTTGEKRPRAAANDLVLQPADVTLEASLPSDDSPAADLAGRSQGADEGPAPAVRRPARVRGPASVAPHPQMSVVYPGPRGDWDAPGVSGGPASRAAGPGGEDRPPRSPHASTRRHRIADGDTLPALAEKYLGRSDRQMEIYQANRDVLTRPDLLPVGVEIRIPPITPVAPAASAAPPAASSRKADAAAQRPSDGSRNRSPNRLSPLVPIPAGALAPSTRAGSPRPDR